MKEKLTPLEKDEELLNNGKGNIGMLVLIDHIEKLIALLKYQSMEDTEGCMKNHLASCRDILKTYTKKGKSNESTE